MPAIDSILEKYNDDVKGLAICLRAFVHQQLPGIIEIPDPTANLIGYGYGKGYKDVICTILLSKKGVKLGIWKGAQLPDPHKLLGGVGKVHRYVEIKTPLDIENPALTELLKAALSRHKANK